MISPRIDSSCQQTTPLGRDCEGRNRRRCVNCFTLGMIVILMETIKDLYIRCAQTPTAIRPPIPGGMTGILHWAIAESGTQSRILVSDIEHIATPVLSSRVPLPDSWRVLKTRKDSDSHPPPPPQRPSGGLHRTRFQKEKNPKSAFSDLDLSVFPSLDCLAQTTGQRINTNSKL